MLQQTIPKRKNINKILAQRQSNFHHLKTFKYQQFVKFCQHQQIATIFGNSRICKRSALLCAQCQKHKRDDHKHQYIDVKKFMVMIKKLKQRYRQYHNLFINKVMPQFFQIVKICTLEYLEGVGSWGNHTLMTNNFFYCTKNKKILSLFSEDVQSWDMTDFTCRDMAQLMYVNQKIGNISTQQFEKDILDDLKQLFKKALMAYELIPQQKSLKKQQQISFEADIQQITAKFNQMLKNIDRSKNIEEPSKSKLSIKINDLVLNQINQYEDALKKGEQKKIIKPEGSTIQQKQEQMNSKLKKMIDTMEDYFSKCHHPSIKINSKIKPQKLQFWHYFFEKIFNILDDVKGRIEEFIFVNQNYVELANLFSQYVQNQEKDLFNQMKKISSPNLEQNKEGNNQTDKKIISVSDDKTIKYSIKNLNVIFRQFSK